jgi:methyl-accepting chemotaxis protein-1 (serine sensor receptor)
MLIVLGIAMIGAFLFSRAICGRSIARSPCAGGGGGDLTRTVDAAGRDEIADLLRALQTMQASLSEVVHEVRTHAEAVATARARSLGNHDLSSRTESQAASLEETAASMTELTGIVGKSAEHAQYAAQLARDASEVASAGGGDDRRRPDDGRHRREFGEGRRDHRRDRRHRVPDQHPRAERGRRGGAGRRAGRGFAVVASEVRSRSAARPPRRRSRGSSSNRRSASIGRGADRPRGRLDPRDRRRGRARDHDRRRDLVGIAEQSAGIQQVNVAVAQMDEATQRNAALVEQASAATQALAEQANALRRAVAVFRLPQAA